MPIQIISNQNPADVERLIRLYKDAGATSVTVASEPDKEVTLIIVYPDAAHPMPNASKAFTDA